MTSQSATSRKRRAATLAVIDRRGGRWRLVIARAAAPESAFLDDADLPKIAQRLQQAGVTKLLRIAPAAECVAKLEPIPDASGEDLSAALALLGEASLPEDAGIHRRAVGIIGSGSDGWALATAWLTPDPAAPTLALHGIEEAWIAEPAAALAFARPDTRGLVTWDREHNSVLSARLTGERPVVRCIRLDGTDAAAWKRGLAAAAAFAGVDADLSSPAGFETSGPLHPAPPASSASALSADMAPALGALRVAMGDDSLATLASLRRESDDGREPATIRAARWISEPRRATAILAAAVGLCIAAPVAFAYVRLKVIDHKLASMAEPRAEADKVSKQAALYSQFEKSRWPMTKLMADVMNAAPVGVSFETFSIEYEGGQGVTIKGSADTADALNTFQKNLSSTRILSGVRVSNLDASGSSTTFSLAAKIANPRVASALKEDFGKSPLADRAGGVSRASRTVPSSSTELEPAESIATDTHTADRPAERGSDRGERGNRGGRNGGGGNGGNNTGGPGLRNSDAVRPGDAPRESGTGRAGRGESATSGETNKAAAAYTLPPPLTDAQINAMDKSTASQEWTKRLIASQRADTLSQDKARLQAEMAKLDPIRKGNAPAPPPTAPPAAPDTPPANDGGDK